MEGIPRGRPAWTACKLLVGFALLGLVLWRNWTPTDGPGLAEAVRKPIRVVPLVLAVLFAVLAPLWGFLRWYWLVRAQGLDFRLRDALRLGCLSYFWSIVLPGAIGGDVVKAILLAREQSRRAAAVATVLMDRVVALLGLFVLAGGAGVVFRLSGGPREWPAALTSLVVISLALTGIAGGVGLLASRLPERFGERVSAWLMGRPLIGPMTAALWDALWLYRSRRASVAVATLLAVLGHIGFLLNFYFAAQVLSEAAADIPALSQHFLIAPAGLLFQSVFPSPGGVGGGEYGFGQLYALLGKPEARGVLASLMARAITWGLCLIGGVAYLLERSVRASHRARAPLPSPAPPEAQSRRAA